MKFAKIWPRDRRGVGERMPSRSMRLSVARVCGATALWLVAAGPVTSMQPSGSAEGDIRMLSVMLNLEYFFFNARSASVEVAVKGSRMLFRARDLDADGVVGPNDKRLMEERTMRAIQLPVLEEILRLDLNLDGVVTRDEIVQGIGQHRKYVNYATSEVPKPDDEIQRQIDADVTRLMQADSNGDGVIEFAEALAFARQKRPTTKLPDLYTDMIAAMDEDGDGSVSLAEFDRGMERAARLVDADGDGILSVAEIAAHKQRQEAIYRASQAAPGAR